jgi:protein phosphatase 1K
VKKLRPDLLYVAIFDGHGGSRCAEYCAEHFQAYLAHFLAREQGVRKFFKPNIYWKY